MAAATPLLRAHTPQQPLTLVSCFGRCLVLRSKGHTKRHQARVFPCCYARAMRSSHTRVYASCHSVCRKQAAGTLAKFQDCLMLLRSTHRESQHAGAACLARNKQPMPMKYAGNSIHRH